MTRNTYQAAVSDTATINPNLVNEARFEFLLGSPITQFLPKIQARRCSFRVCTRHGESRIADLLNHQYYWADTLTWNKGSHQIKAGVGCDLFVLGRLRTGVRQRLPGWPLPDQLGLRLRFRFATLLTYNPGLPPPGSAPKAPPIASSFTQSFGNPQYNVKETLLGVFVQDNWRATQDLTLNLGLRYQFQTSDRVQPRISLRAWDSPTNCTTAICPP